MGKLLFWLAGGLPIRFIDIDHKRYLERYYIGQRFGLTFYLHRFVSNDGDRFLHNHPWRFALGILLRGVYYERFKKGLSMSYKTEYRTLQGWRRFNFISRNSFHQIVGAQTETWTLFIHTNKKEGWGFVEEHRDPLDGSYTIYREPYANVCNDWFLTAPKGRDTNRVPYGEKPC